MLDFARNKEFWERVRTSEDFAIHRQELNTIYEKSFGKSAPRPHSAEEILNNNDNGLWRMQFDHLQSSAILSLIYPENEQYYNDLINTVWAYCNEYTWAPLGHYNSYYGRTPADYDPGLIDIFAASVAFGLAEIKNLFQDRFPQLLKDRIHAEIKRRTIEPYLSRKFFWENHGNNWTAVCSGGVGGAMMYEFPEIYLKERERLDASMQNYLDSFADDGVCVEGTGYWAFGFGFFVNYAALQKELTKGEFDWFKNEKVKTIATFMQKMYLDRDVIVSFSDCSMYQHMPLGLVHMLKSIYPNDIECLPYIYGHMEDNTHFNFLLRSYIYYNPDYMSDSILSNVEYNMENSAIFVKRTPYYGFAAKGGNNGESHNHIDVGNFIISRNNKQIICDLGAGPYEKGYHDKLRYTFFHPSAYSHNLPIFDGIGEDGIRRENVYIDHDKSSSTIKMDIKNGYGIDFLSRLPRKFTFLENEIILEDSYELTRDAEIKERFITLSKPVIKGDTTFIEDVALYADGLVPVISVKEIRHHNDSSTPLDCYILDYILPKGQRGFKISFKMPK